MLANNVRTTDREDDVSRVPLRQLHASIDCTSLRRIRAFSLSYVTLLSIGDLSLREGCIPCDER